MAFVHRTSPGSGVKRPLDSTSSGKANRVSRAICLNWNGARVHVLVSGLAIHFLVAINLKRTLLRILYYYVISSDPDALNVELFFLDLVTISPAIDLIAHFETPPNICFSLPMSALILFAPSLLTVLVNLLYLSDAANAMEAVLWNLVSPSLMRPTFFG
ncbi:hypothetical protein EV361DRAFT_987473 [Lentinula raphanica]|uniref:Uncharacterized protein n=1 Tax=Lentinula raphanica TaxID=153919 RepID=A0AA38NV83_9AGAR|nr:hypothetical protein F5878DRAFT_667776 [Lentinula raphanica]KAJ3963518.1 hypothetical protein EV361DRAFT_987473 [Lentinula raphanica]